MKKAIIFLSLILIITSSLYGCLDDPSGENVSGETSAAISTNEEALSEQTTTDGSIKSTEETSPEATTDESSHVTTDTAETTHIHNFSDATCTAPKTCLDCGTAEGTASPHIFNDGHCNLCGTADPDYVSEEMVWIPTNGGKKYHNKPGCSNMIDPEQVSKSYAISQGFDACKRCY